MNQKDKELLLKDLCARLPYGVMVNVEGYDTEKLIGIENETITTKATPTSYSDKGEYPIDIVKPYLRPLSNMTEEEKEELVKEFWGNHTAKDTFEELSWYLSKHLDVNGLIPKGLAIEVTEDNNPYENNN